MGEQSVSMEEAKSQKNNKEMYSGQPCERYMQSHVDIDPSVGGDRVGSKVGLESHSTCIDTMKPLFTTHIGT